MSNVLQPLTSRYSLFFTLALLDSSRICQSRHPNKTVQAIVLDAQEQYQRRDRKESRHKLRALLRNVSMASASSGATSISHRTNSTVDSVSTSLTSSTISSSSVSSASSITIMSVLSPIALTIDDATKTTTAAIADQERESIMSSFPLAHATTEIQVETSTISPSHHRLDTRDIAFRQTATAFFPSPPVSPHSGNICQEDDKGSCQPHHGPWPLTPASSLSISRATSSSSSSSSSAAAAATTTSTRLQRAIKRKAKQIQRNNRTSIATLLSLALTVIFLNLLQGRRHRLSLLSCSSSSSEKKRIALKTSSRQERYREMNSFEGAQGEQHQQTHHRSQNEDRPATQNRPQDLSSSSCISFSSPSSSLLHSQFSPLSFDMITTACPSATPSPSPHTRHHNPHRCMHSTKEAYVSAWLHHQNLHDQAVEHLHLQHHYYPQYQNQHRPQQHYQHHHQYQQQQQHYSQQHHSPNGTEPNSHNQSPFQPAYSRINLRHRRSISLLKLAEIKDEIRRSQSQSQPQQQQHQEQKQNQGPQKRHSSVHASSNSKSYGSNHSNSSSATVINTAALANASKTTTTSAKPLPPTSQKHRRQMSLYTFNSPEPQHHQQRRSAEELAWDRHYYYQRQQLEEQVYFEQQNRVANLQGHHSGPIIVPSSSNAKLTSESPESAVARAKSLNRLACPAVLSRETSRALGICRSDTLSTNGGGNGIAPSRLRDHLTTGTTKEASSTNSRPVSPLPMHRNRSATFDTNWDHQYRGAPSTPPPSALKHRKTLKEHLAPSLRSLASRLGGGCGNSSNRPSSYAGSRGDLGIFDNNLSSRSATPTAGSSSSHRHSISGHMTDFKPLKVGPETVEHMRRCSVEQQQTPASMDGTTLERKTSHRRVVSLSGHHGGASGSNHSSPRNSLRLANGISGMTPSRSLHLFDDRAMDNQDDDAVEDGDEDEEEEDFIGDNAGRPRCTVLSEDPQSSSGNINNNGNDSMKKQILTILSLRRKSKSSLKSNSTSTTMMATSPMCLSPLELEAQESMPWEEDEEDEGEDEDDMDDADEVKEFEKEPEVGEEERDKDEPEPAVDFLLVPKAQYEFQPLVV